VQPLDEFGISQGTRAHDEEVHASLQQRDGVLTDGLRPGGLDCEIGLMIDDAHDIGRPFTPGESRELFEATAVPYAVRNDDNVRCTPATCLNLTGQVASDCSGANHRDAQARHPEIT
jgi:hypothetical protein